MSKIILVAALSCGCLGAATSAFAQQNENPMGIDYGPFHPAVPPQVTTYYPPPQPAVALRRHHRLHGFTTQAARPASSFEAMR